MKNFTLSGMIAEVSPSTRNRRSTNARRKRVFAVRESIEALEARQLLTGFGPEDGAYIVEPWVGKYMDVRIQPADQKIVTSGYMSITNPDATTDSRMTIARYGSLGAPDTSYGIGGPSIPPLSGLSAPALGSPREYGDSLVLQPDGKALVSNSVKGTGTYDSYHGMARFTTSGSLDSSFGSGGWTSLDPQSNDIYPLRSSLGIQSTGKVVVALPLLSPSAYPAIVGRLKANGALDRGNGGFGSSNTGYALTTFGKSTGSYLNLAVQPADDKIVAVGYSVINGSRRMVVARHTASGTLDKTFNGSGYSMFLPSGINETYGWAVALQSNGKIVVTGTCTSTDGASDMLVARYNTNGTLDTSFGGGSGYVRLDDGAATPSSESGTDIAIQPDGKIVVSGWTLVTGNPYKVMVARLNVNGTPDAAFAPGGLKLGAPPAGPDYHSFVSYGVALQSDGSIIVAGVDSWGTTGDTTHPLLMRFYGSSTASASQAIGGVTPTSAVAESSTLASVQPLLAEAVANWRIVGADAARSGSFNDTVALDLNDTDWGWSVIRSSRRARAPRLDA